MDNQAAVPQGLHAVFYPEGFTWDNAPVVMYANAAHKGPGEETVQTLMEGDEARFRANAPDLTVSQADDLETSDNNQAKVRIFSGEASGNFEAVAYVDGKKVIVILVLRSRTKKDFEASLPAFEKVVGSYCFMADDVRFKKAG